MHDSLTLTMPDGRTVGYADFGPSDGIPVIDCHGGPSTRIEPIQFPSACQENGFRLIGIDRPGYGLSDPLPGRVIADWTPDCLAVADALGLDRFMIVGVSTGASYSMCVAAQAPDRVLAAAAVCGISDARDPAVRAAFVGEEATIGIGMKIVWEAPDRETALANSEAMFRGELDGGALALCPADLEMLADPEFAPKAMAANAGILAFGAQGYCDDRWADGLGWGSFDVGAIRCPVRVLHGGEDGLVPVSVAEHTAAIVPGARLRVVPGLGHLSIFKELPALLDELRAAAGC